MKNKKDNSCYYCANLTNKAKTSFIALDILEEGPCILHKMPRKDAKLFGKWKAWDIDCKFFKAENSAPVKKCKGCGFNLGSICFLHAHPNREWIVKCNNFDKNAWEVKAIQTKIYKKYNKEFECRMGYDGLMPLSWRMHKGINCSLCEDRGGDNSCPLTNGYLRKTLEVEFEKEIPNFKVKDAN